MVAKRECVDRLHPCWWGPETKRARRRAFKEHCTQKCRCAIIVWARASGTNEHLWGKREQDVTSYTFIVFFLWPSLWCGQWHQPPLARRTLCCRLGLCVTIITSLCPHSEVLTGLVFSLRILRFRKQFSPVWCGSVDWAPACKPKGCRFDSQSGHMPGVRAQSPLGARDRPAYIDISLPLSPTLPLCFKINK